MTTVNVTGTTRRTSVRARLAPIVATGGAAALVTVGLIGPDTGAADETAPVEVRVELVDRRPVEVVAPPADAFTTVMPSVTTSVTTGVPSTASVVASTTVVPTAVPTFAPTPVARASTTTLPTSTVALPIDVRPLTDHRWVAGDLPVGVAPGPADETALRSTAQRAWTTYLVTRREPGDAVPVAVGRSVRSGHAARRFDDEVAAFASSGRRAVADPGIPSSMAVLDLGLADHDRAVVTVCTFDSDVVVVVDGAPAIDGTDASASGITREVTRYGMVRVDGGWLLDDLHTLDRRTFPSTDPEALQRC